MLAEQVSNTMLFEAPGTGVCVAVFPEELNRLLNDREPRWLTDSKVRVQQWSEVMCNSLSCRAGKHVIL